MDPTPYRPLGPRAVVFDIGGVLVRTEDWSGRRKWECRLGLPEWGLNTLVFNCEPAILASVGRGPDEAIWQHVRQECGLSRSELDRLRVDFWSGDRLNHELAEFVGGLRPHYRTGILSNAWPEMRDLNVERFGMRNLVDVTVYSFESGLLKPDPQAYEYVATKLGVPANEMVFVDDALRNVEGAREVGTRAVLYLDNPQAIADVRALLPA